MTVQTGDAPRAERLARMLASPTGVLIAVPALVGAAGVAILLLGRSATRDSTDSMARRQLASQAVDVQHDVAFALDQAAPMLARLRELADPKLPITDVGVSLRDLQLGRAGVVNTSIGFPSGTMRGSYIEDGEVRVQESLPNANGTVRTNYRVVGGVQAIATKTTDYDVRKRSHYELAQRARTRAWTAPRVYFTSHTTGVTCVEPIYGADGALAAVITVDFDVGALSQFVVRAPLEGARTIVFSGDGAILAFPGAPLPAAAATENRLLRYTDYDDPAIRGLFDTLGNAHVPEQRFVTIHADDEDYLASVAPVGGVRAGVAAPLDWYLATLVPEHVLLGPTRRLERQSILASAGALAMALGIALVFAWNLVRMRRAVGEARERARSAEAHARDLGSYRLVARLGTGGMGEVWRAEHRLLVRQAAIKIMRTDKLRDRTVAAKIRERFRREAQTLAQLRSRHTIALFDYGVSEDGVFFYVMELLDGLDLEKLVREFGPLPPARVISILLQACQSLGEAHDAGLLHRDIKPANLFLCREADEIDIIKVLDFGIVHAMTEGRDPLEAVSLQPDADMLFTARSKLTMHGAVVGTPGFIAPEQVLGTGVDVRSDLYALGCVAWWLLTATEVFGRPDEDSAMRAHAEEPVPELRPRVKGWFPDALETLVLACLAKKREDRPASARDLATALRAIDVPAEHAWTEDRARAWWYVHRPVEARQDSIPTAEVPERVLVPQRVRDVDLEAETVEARRVR